MNNWLGILVSYLAIFLVIITAKLFEKKGKEASRKFIHIALGNWWLIAMYFFNNIWFAIFPPATFVIINYISYKNEDGSSSIVEIDLLKSDYPEKTILSMENTEINNLEYYSGKIYFVTENGRLVEYSIDEENTNFWTEENETSSFVIDKNNNCLYFSYKPNGENPGIYSLDFTSNTYTELVTLNDFAGELLLNGDSLVIDAKEYQSIYVYNKSLVSVTGIGSDNLNSTSKQVDFFGDLILYTNGEKVDIKDSSGNSYQDNWYNSNGDLFTDVSMISSNNLQVTREDGQNSVIIDLTTGNITEMEGSPYSDVVIIK